MNGPRTVSSHEIDANARGLIEKLDGICNTAIVSKDANVYKAEYEAGVIQGTLQAEDIIAARDNAWDGAYLTDPDHVFPREIPPPAADLAAARDVLVTNWDSTLRFIRTTGDAQAATGLRRLMYRLIGIYHGAAGLEPRTIAFDERWLPEFTEAELSLGYETPSLTFLDLYWINANADLMDYMAGHPVTAGVADAPPSRCSAFVLDTGEDFLLAHNTWMPFLDQSQALSLWIAGDLMTCNLVAPGSIGSGTDFGYTSHGIMFNETTHRWSHTEPSADSLWMFWRATLAEQFATSIDDFFRLISLEASGTYMSGYMVADVKTHEIGYVEMSYDTFVFYRLRPGGRDAVQVTTKPEGRSTAYDEQLVRPDSVLGINFPASLHIREQLRSQDNRPARRRQFLAGIGGVHDIETAKDLITYTAPDNPLSIYGRWDLGYGDTPSPTTIPDGSCDAKAVSGSMVGRAARLKGELDPAGGTPAFWMKYGTPEVDGEPFVWSESPWPGQKLRRCPDRVEGDWQLLDLHIR